MVHHLCCLCLSFPSQSFHFPASLLFPPLTQFCCSSLTHPLCLGFIFWSMSFSLLYFQCPLNLSFFSPSYSLICFHLSLSMSSLFLLVFTLSLVFFTFAFQPFPILNSSPSSVSSVILFYFLYLPFYICFCCLNLIHLLFTWAQTSGCSMINAHSCRRKMRTRSSLSDTGIFFITSDFIIEASKPCYQFSKCCSTTM